MSTIPVFLLHNTPSESDEFPAEMKGDRKHGMRFLFGFW